MSDSWITVPSLVAGPRRQSSIDPSHVNFSLYNSVDLLLANFSAHAARRLVIRAIVGDKLSAIADFLVKIADLHVEYKSVLSVDSTLITTHGTTSVLVLSLKMEEEKTSLEEESIVQAQVTRAAKEAFANAGRIAIRCEWIDALSDDLYRGRGYREMRLTSRLGGIRTDELLPVCEEITAALAGVEDPIPVVSLSYPYSWGPPANFQLMQSDGPRDHIGDQRSAEDRSDWLRVIYAEPKWSLLQQIDIEHRLLQIAQRRNLRLALYTPDPKRPTHGTRFLELTDGPIRFTQNAHGDTGSRPNLSHTMAATLTTMGVARAGYIRDFLCRLLSVSTRSGGTADCESINMAVVSGYTTISATLLGNVSTGWDRPGTDTELMTQLAEDQILIAGERRYSDPSTEPLPEFSFWCAWESPEQSGVLGAVLKAVQTHARSAFDADLIIKFCVTRVLLDGNTCAGKAQFSCMRQASRTYDLDQLSRLVKEEIAGAPLLRGDKVEVRFESHEPSERPWGSIGVPLAITSYGLGPED